MQNANYWLAGKTAWQWAAEQSVLTCVSVWQTLINNLSLTLYKLPYLQPSSLSHVSKSDVFAPLRWCVCVCVSAQMHAQCWHLIGKERQSIYFSLLNSTQRDGISHQSWLTHRPCLSHAHTLRWKQVKSEILLLRRRAVFLWNINKYRPWSSELASWFCQVKEWENTLFTHSLHPLGVSH